MCFARKLNKHILVANQTDPGVRRVSFCSKVGLHHLGLGEGDLIWSDHPVVVQVQHLEEDCHQLRISDDLLSKDIQGHVHPKRKDRII